MEGFRQREWNGEMLYLKHNVKDKQKKDFKIATESI